MSINSEFTALADQVRALRGQTGKMSIGAMTEAIEGVLAELETVLDTQESKLNALLTALDGKMVVNGTPKLYSGTVTPSYDTSRVDISNGVSEDDIFVICAQEPVPGQLYKDKVTSAIWHKGINEDNCRVDYVYTYEYEDWETGEYYEDSYHSYGSYGMSIDDYGYFVFGSMYLAGSVTYRWYLVKKS